MELLFDGGIRIVVEPGDTKGTVAVWASTGSRVAPNWVTFQLSVAGVATFAAAMKANISTASSPESSKGGDREWQTGWNAKLST